MVSITSLGGSALSVAGQATRGAVKKIANINNRAMDLAVPFFQLTPRNMAIFLLLTLNERGIGDTPLLPSVSPTISGPGDQLNFNFSITTPELGPRRYSREVPNVARGLIDGIGRDDLVSFLRRDGERVAVGGKIINDISLFRKSSVEPFVVRASELSGELRRAIAPNADYLHVVPLVSPKGHPMGLVTIASNNSDLIEQRKGEIIAAGRKIGRDLKKANSYFELRRDATTGSHNQVAWYNDTRFQLMRGEVITRIIINFSLRAINEEWGHNGGDAFLLAIKEKMDEFFLEHSNEFRGYRRGPNFEFDLDGDIDSIEVMQKLYSFLISAPIKFVIKDSETKKETPAQATVDPNIGAWQYDHKRDGKTDKMGHLRLLTSMVTSSLNTQGDSERQNFKVFPFDAKIIGEYSTDERLVEQTEIVPESQRMMDTPGWKDALEILKDQSRKEMAKEGVPGADSNEIREWIRTKYIEPDSGLFNKRALRVFGPRLAEKARREGKQFVLVSMDVNKMGAFIKTYDFFGSSIIDVLLSNRFSSAAAEFLGGEGIIPVRTDTGSEEYYACAIIDPASMIRGLNAYTEALNRPLAFRARVAEMTGNWRSRMYVASMDEASRVVQNGGDDYLSVDAMEMPRWKSLAGISWTGAYSVINPEVEGDRDEMFAATMSAAELAGEAAKAANKYREQLWVGIDQDGNISAPDPSQKLYAQAAQLFMSIEAAKAKKAAEEKITGHRKEDDNAIGYVKGLLDEPGALIGPSLSLAIKILKYRSAK